MADTFQATALTVVLVLPGAVYLWGFEREAGKWGIGLSETLLRFVAAAALFQAVYVGPLYVLYEQYVHDVITLDGRAVVKNRLANGDLPLWLVIVPLVYVGVPALVGTLVGRAVRSEAKVPQAFARIMAGRDPAPRAWDDLFARGSGTVRIRLKSDHSWVGGAFDDHSYAAGYPEEPQDLLLSNTYRMAEDGTFERDDDDEFAKIGSKLLIRFEEMDFLEFFPTEA